MVEPGGGDVGAELTRVEDLEDIEGDDTDGVEDMEIGVQDQAETVCHTRDVALASRSSRP